MKTGDYYKTVMLPIRVPVGDFCWDRSYPRICDNFSNDYGYAECKLCLGEPKIAPNGNYKKTKRCLKLEDLK